MPRAENDTSARGLPKGAEKAQQEFVTATQPGDTVDPLQSPVNTPTPPQAEPQFTPPKSEPVQPNTLDNGMNLDDVLYAPTDRPSEPLTTGITTGVQQIKLSQTLQSLPPSPDVQALQRIAAEKGL